MSPFQGWWEGVGLGGAGGGVEWGEVGVGVVVVVVVS